MKRVFALVLILILIAIVVPSLAAGKLVTTKENRYSIYSNNYFCAELKNEGDKPIEFVNGVLELLDAEGNTIHSSTISLCYPIVLQPEENGYLYSNQYLDENVLGAIDDHMFSFMGQGKITRKVLRLEANAIYETISDGYYESKYLTATITNTTSEIIRYIEVVFALKDVDGNILYINTSCWSGYSVGILPGSSIQYQVQMDYTIDGYLTENNIIPAVVDCIAYNIEQI